MTTALTDEEFIRRRNRGRWTLVLLAVIFLGPLALAFLLYYGDVWKPAGSAIHGQLIEPARPLPTEPLTDAPGAPRLEGLWSLLVIEPAACDEICQSALVETRQVRRALGSERERVQRIWIVTAGAVDAQAVANEHPLLGVVAADTPAPARVVEMIGPSKPGEVLVVDPLGNLMMRFPPGTSMRAMHTDLKKLLKISRIG